MAPSCRRQRNGERFTAKNDEGDQPPDGPFAVDISAHKFSYVRSIST
jgi:hypothetical protein